MTDFINYNYYFFPGDNEFSETVDKCLECMHTKEVCVIPYKKENGNLEFASFLDGDLWCEIELLSFLKVDQY